MSVDRAIWKFPFDVADVVEVEMPAGAEVVALQEQHGHPTLWAIVDPDADLETRHFAVRGTGHVLGDVGPYVGTFQVMGGHFVGHVFEAVPER